MPSKLDTEHWIGIAVGSLSGLFGIALGGLFLVLVGEGAIGALQPFTELVTDGVDPVTASTWTWFDASIVAPTVQWDNVVVTRSVLTVLDGAADTYSSTLWVLPPVILTLAGGATVSIARRLFPERCTPVAPVAGSYVALGYTPVMLVALWLSHTPVAPGATGTVEVGSTITDAADVAGVTAGPSLVLAIVVMVLYPLCFGTLGGVLFGLVAKDES